MRSLLPALVLLASPALADTPVLTVYTYDSFVSDWGPGPQIEAAFEQTCNCDLQFVAAGDGAALLARVKLEGARTPADVVLGLDTNLTAEAAATGLFAPHDQTAIVDIPNPQGEAGDWTDPYFLPYDWGYFAFVYDSTKLTDPPGSLKELAGRDDDIKIVIQDPRSSTPGLGLVMWVKAAYGQHADLIWEALSPKMLTVTPGWSEAYGLFLDGEADMVLSYTTSPAYHRIAEGDLTKEALAFAEGNYMQIEVAGKIATTDQPDLADQFLTFMLSDAFQAIIPTTNWMYPAITPDAGLPAGFDDPVDPNMALLFPADEAAAIKAAAVAEWRRVLGR